MTAYLARDGEEELVLEDVGLVEAEGETVWLTTLFGERQAADARIKAVDLIHNKLLLEKRD